MTSSTTTPYSNPEQYINYRFVETKAEYEEVLEILRQHSVLQLDCETCGRDAINHFIDQMEWQAQLDNVIMTSGEDQIIYGIDQIQHSKKLVKDLEEYLKGQVPGGKVILTALPPENRAELTARRKQVRDNEVKYAFVKDYERINRKIKALQKLIEADKSGLIFHRCILALVQVGTMNHEQFFFDPQVIDERFNEVMQTRKAVIGMNLKFDMSVLAYHKGLDFSNSDTVMYDIMLADKGLNSGRVRSFRLKDIAERWLDYKQSKEEQLSYWLARPLSDEQLKYAALDVITPGLIFRRLKEEIQITGEHLVEWTKLQMQFLKELTEMELTGFYVDINATQTLIDEITPMINQMRIDIADGFYIKNDDGEQEFIPGIIDELEFDEETQENRLKDTKDLASPKETLSKLKNYGIKHDIPTLTYLTGTGKEAFEEIEERIPIIEKISSFRSLVKTRKDFCGDIIEFQVDSRIHSNYTQIQKEGTRMSSKQPNVQNISQPGSIEDGETYEETYMRWKPSQRLRTLFVPPPGYKMYDCDYSQIELYMIAYYSQDAAMMQAINDGIDLHIQAANNLFGLGWSYDDLKDKSKIKEFKKLFNRERQIAKTFNFAVVYGAGAKKLIKQLYKAEIYDMDEVMVNELKRAWYRSYPGVKAWQDATLSIANHQGLCTTRMGRDIYFDDAFSVYSKAFNTPIQASCYEGLQRAVVIFKKKVRDLEMRGIIKKGDIQLANLVHDEFVVYAKANISEASIKRLIQESMIEGIQPLMENEYSEDGELLFARVPVAADCARVNRWSDK